MELLQCTASLPGGSGQWNSCNALPRCLGAVGSANRAMHCLTHCVGAVGSGISPTYCHTAWAWGQWACLGTVGSATPPMHCLTHGLGAVDNATPATQCLTAWGQWAVELLQCTASLPGGSG